MAVPLLCCLNMVDELVSGAALSYYIILCVMLQWMLECGG